LQLITTPEIRYALINNLWQYDIAIGNGNSIPDYRFDSFFEYYEQQCIPALHDGRKQMLIQTHQDLVDIVQELRDEQALRSSIHEKLQPRLSALGTLDEHELLCDAINLAARIWLMTFVGAFRNVAGPSQRALQWEQNESLASLLSREFSDQAQITESAKLERLFVAQNIEQIGGIKIKWTSNLADHLRLIDDDKRVAIFIMLCSSKPRRQGPLGNLL
jgi:hypothetical protein